MNNFLLNESLDLKSSSVYIGYVILQELQRKEKVSILDLYGVIKRRVGAVSYQNTMNSLVFLRMCGLVEFKAPYFYPKKEVLS